MKLIELDRVHQVDHKDEHGRFCVDTSVCEKKYHPQGARLLGPQACPRGSMLGVDFQGVPSGLRKKVPSACTALPETCPYMSTLSQRGAGGAGLASLWMVLFPQTLESDIRARGHADDVDVHVGPRADILD